MNNASQQQEIERLIKLHLDARTGTHQRVMIRALVLTSVALVVAGFVISKWNHEIAPHDNDLLQILSQLPNGAALMMLGLLLGAITPFARTLLLATWFARRGERAMVIISLLLAVIMLSGLFIRQ